MTRRTLIERIKRLIYGEFPQDNSNITDGLINQWINDAIGVVVKKNWLENISLDGIAYVNNSFYLTFKGITITQDEVNLYKFTLPQIPIALGRNEGIASVTFKDANGRLSFDAIPLSTNQVSYVRSMKNIPNKTLYYSESNFVYTISIVPLNLYTASVRMISGGDSNNLDSELNVSADFIPQIIDYVYKYLTIERNTPQDITNDGRDNSPKQ
jgi:hypothetical protein